MLRDIHDTKMPFQAWLDEANVLLGTKCYQLVCANVNTGWCIQMPLPMPVQPRQEQPPPSYVDKWVLCLCHTINDHRRGDPLAAWLWITQPDAGIRTLTLSPCRQHVLVGGRNPTEALILPTFNTGTGPSVLLVRAQGIACACTNTAACECRDIRTGFSRDAGSIAMWPQLHRVTARSSCGAAAVGISTVSPSTR